MPSRVSWRAVGLWALVITPIVVAMVVAPTKEWFPTSDYALIELSTRDVGAHTPLVGPFSRYGWNHPGPLLFWTLAAPYRVMGSHSWGLLVAAGIMNIGAVATILWVAFRRGRWPFLVLIAFAVALLLRGLGGTFLVDPWNPSITLLPFVLLVLLAWSLSLGSYRLAPATVFVAAFVAQTHVGYVPVAAAVSAWGFVLLVWRLWIERRERPERWAAQRRRVGGWLVASVIVGVACLAPIAIEQGTTEPGNLTQIYDHFSSSGAPSAGLERASSIAARHLSPTGPWLTGHEPTDVFTGDVYGAPRWWALGALALFGAAFAVAWRGRDRQAVLFQATVAVALAAGFVAIARTTGETYPYLFNWMRALGMLVWVSGAWSAYRALPDELSARVRTVGGPLLVAATGVVSLLTVYSAATFEVPYEQFSEAMSDLREPTVEAVGETPVLIAPIGQCWAEVLAGIALEIEKQGGTIRARPELEFQYGTHRSWNGTNAEQQLTVGCREGATYDPLPDRGELIAYSGPFTPAEDRRFNELADEISSQLVANGREDLVSSVPTGWITVVADSNVDSELLAEYEELASKAQHRTAVYLGPLPEE